MKPRKSNVTFSDDAALEYIMALENPHKVGWDSKNRVWRTPKKKGYDKNQIAYGLDIRQDHNPVVYNFLKEKGRLKDPWLTEGEATDLMAQLYAAKNGSVNKAVEKMGGNISQRGYNVLRGMAWHGHPMKQLLNPDSITGKAFLRAIANGDQDLNSVFDAYYGYGSNATQFADRIKADARLRGSIIMETLGDGNKRMRFLPVPQWEPQPLPKPIPETQYPLSGSQAPESISSWNGADSPSAVPTIPSIQKLNNKRNADIQGAFSLPLVTVIGNRRTSLLPRIPNLSDIMLVYSPLNQLNRLLAQSLGLDEFLNDLDVTSDLFKFKNGKLPKYEDGRGWVRDKNGNDISFDEQTGELKDLITGEKGTLLVPEITVTPNYNDPYYDLRIHNGQYADDTWHKNWLENRLSLFDNNVLLNKRRFRKNGTDTIEGQLNNLRSSTETIAPSMYKDWTGDSSNFYRGTAKGNGVTAPKRDMSGNGIFYNKRYSGIPYEPLTRFHELNTPMTQEELDVWNRKQGYELASPEDIYAERVKQRTRALNPVTKDPDKFGNALPQHEAIRRINKKYKIDGIDPDTAYGELMLDRYKLGLLPDHVVTKEEIQKWRDSQKLSPGLNIMPDDVLLEYFNEVASNPNPLFDPNAVLYTFGPSGGKMLYAKNGKLPIMFIRKK